ncbi:voltage-dependent calcium channel unc-36 [Plakobranchus ocellatus]|uniref:Voltage-dependent calcium channel unc-36 n=1 Tax=Plakobranchus ocellatus TaxID=259542 RepID=A0AAV4B4L9_9GAST|nr:voltage-dependent calcium channel unc-36 [Plakobranchus ocellatus]
MPCPNKSTNDIYYRRQLSFHSFNVHALATDCVHIYGYDETVARKGADEVTSMLAHYFANFVPDSVRTLKLFCDSCCGQNINYTMIRFLYYFVHCLNRFDLVKVIFP